MEKPKNVTPAMAQFYNIKEQYPDSILFFRMGDFYEMFGDDAVTASKILGIALTCRNKSSENQVPLCGIPYHSYMPYLVKLLKAGKKVAICEQLEDPKFAKGVVKRGVTRVVTPGTALEDEANVTFDNNFLLSMYAELEYIYIAAIDVTTGETFLKTINTSALESSSLTMDVKEIISNIDLEINNIPVTLRQTGKVYNNALNKVLTHYNVSSEKALFIDEKGYIWALAMALDYLDDLMLTTKLMLPVTLKDDDYLILDNVAASTLELVTSNNGVENSLFYVLNKTATPMGARFLKSTLLRPLRNIYNINKRFKTIEYLIANPSFLDTVSGLLSNIFDIERITSRLISLRATPKDLIWLKLSLESLPELKAMLLSVPEIFNDYKLEGFEDLYNLIDKAIINEPPVNIKEGGIIKSGYNSHIDELRDIKVTGKSKIAEMEEAEKKKTGINQLKIGYNKVFGYYFEVSRLNASKMPAYFERKQTLANSERFVTEELRELENKILNAEEKLADIEYAIFSDIRKYASEQADSLRKLAKIISELDLVISFAHVSMDNNYVMPKIVEKGNINIVNGRHAVFAKSEQSGKFRAAVAVPLLQFFIDSGGCEIAAADAAVDHFHGNAVEFAVLLKPFAFQADSFRFRLRHDYRQFLMSKFNKMVRCLCSAVFIVQNDAIHGKICNIPPEKYIRKPMFVHFAEQFRRQFLHIAEQNDGIKFPAKFLQFFWDTGLPVKMKNLQLVTEFRRQVEKTMLHKRIPVRLPVRQCQADR